MSPEQVVQEARPGDILLVSGSWILRALTCESASHVALITTRGMVCEYKANGGWRTLPLTDWLNGYRTQVWYGKAPKGVHNNLGVAAYASKYGRHEYGFFEAAWVWVCQAFGKRWSGKGRFCSTYVQRVWSALGWDGPSGSMYPGDFFDHVVAYPIRKA